MSLWTKIKSFFGLAPKEVKVEQKVPEKVEPVLRPTQRVVVIPKTPVVQATQPTVQETTEAKLEEIQEKISVAVKESSESVKTELSESVKKLEAEIADVKTKVEPKQPTKKWVCKVGEKAKMVLSSEVKTFTDLGWSVGKKCK